jgi:ribosome assembly protein 1
MTLLWRRCLLPADDGDLHLINLVDSPGHCDFSGEVEAALRVCDGAIVVVDVVEGVCVQTISVLRAALEHGVRPVLVLNKLDRLFDELQLTPMDAYDHIQRVLEQTNVVMGVRQVEDMMARADLGAASAAPAGVKEVVTNSARKERGPACERPPADEEKEELIVGDEEEEEDHSSSGYFSPEKGNVAFASAIDGWAFRIIDFADLFSDKFGLSKAVLMKTLWGNFYLQPKTKKIVRKRTSSGSADAKPMFVQFVLTSLHFVYESLRSTQHDMQLAISRRENIVSKLGLKITNRDLKHKDASVALQAIMNAWLPAAPALLRLIVEQLPNAATAQADASRLVVLWPHLDRSSADCEAALAERQRTAIETADSSPTAPVLAYVTKMLEPVGEDAASGARMNIRMPKSRAELDASRAERQDEKDTSSLQLDSSSVDAEESFGLVAFTRILSGTISVGDSLYVYGPRYTVAGDGSSDATTVHTAKVSGLFLLMGRDMDPICKARAGNIVGIQGFSNVILKTATLSSLPPGQCLPLLCGARSSFSASRDAVVRVAVEPHLPGDVAKLQAGLRKLNQADPAVDTYVTSKGEHVIAASGELHLERCLLDLREHFAKGVRIHVSRPIVSFRETAMGGTPTATSSELQDSFRTTASEGQAKFAEAKSSADDKQDNCETTFKPPDELPSGLETGRREQGEVAASTPTVWRTTVSPARTSAVAVVNSPFFKHGRFVDAQCSNMSFRICAAPMPEHLAATLDEAGATLRASASLNIDSASKSEIDALRAKIEVALRRDSVSGAMRPALKSQFLTFWMKEVLTRLWSSGPRRLGSNILVGPRASLSLPEPLRCLFCSDSDTADDANGSTSSVSRLEFELEKAIITGFQLASQAGPLCEEPMHGVAFFVDSLEVRDAMELGDGKANSVTAGVAGLAISPAKDAIRLSLLNANPRIMEAVLQVDVSVAGDALGKTYTVLAKRRGRVLSEDMKDGVNVFNVKAFLPVIESFGFADALRKQTSGLASAQLLFGHWETVDVDPFWTPRTEEELEDLGREDSTEADNNLARKLVNSVRRRKGLKIEEKIVEKAEKQRTLSKNK